MLKAIQPVCGNKHIFLLTIHFCHSHLSSHGCSLKAKVTLACWFCSSLLWDGKEVNIMEAQGETSLVALFSKTLCV